MLPVSLLQCRRLPLSLSLCLTPALSRSVMPPAPPLPQVPPQPGQIVTGYEVVRPAAGCCQFDGLSPAGLIAIIILVLIFWPLAWVPCVMPDCYEPYQRPIYGWPVQQQQQGPPPPPYQQAP